MFAPISTPHLYVPHLAQRLGYSIGLNLYLKDESQQRGRSKRIARAKQYVREGYYWPNQYDGPEWIKIHQETTGPEIWCDNIRYDLVVGAVGTGATVSGVALARPVNSNALVVAVEPAGSSIFGSPAGPYRVAGAGNPFRPKNYRPELIDVEVTVDDNSAFLAARTLRASGLHIGSSGAMAIVGALRAAEQLEEAPRTAVVIVADDGWYESIGDTPRS